MQEPNLPYQTRAIEEAKKRNILLTFPAGSGKTRVAHSILEKPFLICSFKYVIYQHIHILGFGEINKITPDWVFCTPNFLTTHWTLMPKFKTIILDESHMFKNRTSKRTLAAMGLIILNPEARILCMTATPCPENVGELYPQIYLLNPNTKLGNPERYRKRYEHKVFCTTHWETRIKHQDEILEEAKKYIYTEPIEMPKQIIKDISIPMPKKELQLYEQAKRECYIKIEELGFEAFLQSNLWIKLLQICSGFIKDSFTKETARISKHKIQFLKEMIEDIDPENAIIWSCFREELFWLKEEIPDSELVIGGIDNSEGIQKFKDKKVRFLIANPACIGAGLSFEVCHTVFVLSVSPSGVMYDQMLSRTNRRNQKEQEYIYRIYYSVPEQEKLYKAVTRKNLTEKEILRECLLKQS